MKSKALILIALVLALSVFAEENSQNEIKDNEPLHTNTFTGYGGGIGAGGGGGGSDGGSGGGAGSYGGGISHGGAYGGGKFCKWGCCSESYGYSHAGGGYYSCNCCATFAEAKAFMERESHSKLAETKN